MGAYLTGGLFGGEGLFKDLRYHKSANTWSVRTRQRSCSKDLFKPESSTLN